MVLFPVFDQRVIVTLGTADIHSEKQDGGVVGQVVKIAGPVFDKLQRRLLMFVFLVAGEHVPEHQIPGTILLDRPL